MVIRSINQFNQKYFSNKEDKGIKTTLEESNRNRYRNTIMKLMHGDIS
jgi:hypothetical protein